ncbi:hypothetical protein [Macrococcus brunensis]|uniref:hypothetical protein n=1 Tax=Macrococcus brunensis TaxID=198483 RepID=UPI001EF024D5|nr:hypothetical protein [Macrococcus brunensis]ULG71385.1 hypothetical protein MGG12_08555 [Macrococcus brunensis]
MDTELYSSIVSVEGYRQNLNRADLLDLFESKINMTDHWDFDIVYKTDVHDRLLVFIEVNRELEGKGGKREKVVWFLTFHKRGDSYKLIRLYAEELI